MILPRRQLGEDKGSGRTIKDVVVRRAREELFPWISWISQIPILELEGWLGVVFLQSLEAIPEVQDLGPG